MSGLLGGLRVGSKYRPLQSSERDDGDDEDDHYNSNNDDAARGQQEGSSSSSRRAIGSALVATPQHSSTGKGKQRARMPLEEREDDQEQVRAAMRLEARQANDDDVNDVDDVDDVDVAVQRHRRSQPQPPGALAQDASHYPDPNAKTGVLTSAVNLISSVIGGGLLSIPYAFSQSGAAVGVIILIFLVIVSTHSAHLLVASKAFCVKAGLLRKGQAGTYENIAYSAFGKVGFYIVVVLVFLLCFLTCVAYLILIGDSLTPLVRHWISSDIWLAERHVAIILSALLLFPVCALRSLSALKFSSLFGVVAALFITLAVSFRLFGSGISPSIVAAGSGLGFLTTTAVLGVSFLCHFNVGQTHAELKDATPSRVSDIFTITFMFSSFVYLTFGLVGYFQFGAKVSENILNSFADSDGVINLARLMFVCLMWTSYPLLAFPCRAALDQLIFGEQPWERTKQIVETLFIVVNTLLCALFIPNVLVVWGFIGTTVAVAILFLLPPLFYLKLRPAPMQLSETAVQDGRDGDAEEGGADAELEEIAWYKDYSGLIAAGMIALGVALLIIGNYHYFSTVQL